LGSQIRQLAERKNVFANFPAWSRKPAGRTAHRTAALRGRRPKHSVPIASWPAGLACLPVGNYSLGRFATLRKCFTPFQSEKENIFGNVASQVYRLQQKGH
jgi:hypothetical protein